MSLRQQKLLNDFIISNNYNKFRNILLHVGALDHFYMNIVMTLGTKLYNTVLPRSPERDIK